MTNYLCLSVLRELYGMFLSKIKTSFLKPKIPSIPKSMCVAYEQHARTSAKGWAGRIGYGVLQSFELCSHLYSREIILFKLFLQTDNPDCAHPAMEIKEDTKFVIPSLEFTVLIREMIPFVQQKIHSGKLSETTNYQETIINALKTTFAKKFLLLFCINEEHHDFPAVGRIYERVVWKTTNYLVNAHRHVVCKNSAERQNKTAVRKMRRAEDLLKLKKTI